MAYPFAGILEAAEGNGKHFAEITNLEANRLFNKF